MKLLRALLLLLPLTAAALPQAVPAPLGGQQITDPARIAELEKQHAHVLDSLRSGKVVVATADDLRTTQFGTHEKRVFQVFGLAGVVLIEAIGAGVDILGTLAERLYVIFTASSNVIWHDTDYCRTYFQTHAGGEEEIQTFARGETAITDKHTQNVGWNNPEHSDPPILYFEDSKSVGIYSVQFTGTDKVAWSGIEGTEKCVIEGLCNPQYVFYRDGYNIVLNTWQSQGLVSACQYSKGEDCKGLCSSGVMDQFPTNGVKWGGNCAIPCIGDEGDGIPTAPKQDAKIMIAGDSISHGMEKDFTWRWRLYEWLDHLGYRPSFVGPWAGTFGPQPLTVSQPDKILLPGEPAKPETPAVVGQYADAVSPEFANTAGHASRWGRQAAQTKDTIQQWVADAQPDYLLLLLGFNDLGWFVSGPEGLVGNMGSLIDNARKAKPDIKILVGNVVDRSFIGGRQDLVDNTKIYNKLLKDTLPGWFRWESPIAYVDVNSVYKCRPDSCPDGYDGLHPTALGEYHIAQAFATVLKNNFNFKGPDLAVPDNVPARTVSTPANVRALAMPEGLFTTWDRVDNARGYSIRARLQGMTSWWSEGTVYPNTWGSWRTWVLNGQTWEFSVRSNGDHEDGSAWSGVVSQTAKISTSPGPSNIKTLPDGGDGISLSWDPVAGFDVSRYGVIIWDLDTPGAITQQSATTGISHHISGLIKGHRYGTWISTYVNMQGSLSGGPVAVEGWPVSGRDVIIGAGVPPPPTNLQAVNTDATTVSLVWSLQSGAAGYIIYINPVKDESSVTVAGNTTDSLWGAAFLFPGTWTYRFCVTSYNGHLESGKTCIVPPVYPGFETRDLTARDGTVDMANITQTTGGDYDVVNNSRLRAMYAQLMQDRASSDSLAPESADQSSEDKL